MSPLRISDIIRERYKNRKTLRPTENIDIVGFDKARFLNGQKAQFIWYGHSTLVFRIDGKTIIVDPMFGQDVTPMLPTKNKRYSRGIENIIEVLPEVDIVLLTHDHYDHLDYKSIKEISGKVKHFYGPLGIARHLIKWGVDDDRVSELDWYDKLNIEGIDFLFTPSKHYSGRRFSDRNLALWGGWIIKSSSISIYLTGDGGYNNIFKEIGRDYGPFDWCFSECGQYNEMWRDNHMFPDESAQAAIDSHAKTAIPIHWGGFTLAMHPWREPVQQFVEYIEDSDTKICVPHIGAIVQLGHEQDAHSDWYNEIN